MYSVDKKDKVVKLEDVPQSSVGAPGPIVLSDEGKTILAFRLQDNSEGWDVRPESEQPSALVEFKSCYDYMFGGPNDEAFDGHPLAGRGLKPYGAYEIVNSSWIRQLERMNSVHPRHEPERFWKLHHYIFAFHDSTFECVAAGFHVTQMAGSTISMVSAMTERLWTR